MNMLKKLNDAISYVEQNLCEDIAVEEISRIVGLTQDSFLRFFSYMTGMSLNEYIRRRRMTLAAEDVRQGNERVLDIAMKYGYESADAFSRAFAKQHGTTPTAFRKNDCSAKAYPPVSFHIIIKGGKEMNFRIIEVEDTAVYGVSKKYDTQVYQTREALRHSMWDTTFDNVPGQICVGEWNECSSTSRDGIWYGVWFDGNYMIGREKEAIDMECLEKHVIPAGKYAAFTTERGVLASNAFQNLFESIFESWLPNSNYKLRGDEIIEIYHLWTACDIRRKNRYYEVWIPVDEK